MPYDSERGYGNVNASHHVWTQRWRPTKQKEHHLGWFAGGFALTGKNTDGTPACGASSTGLASPTGTHDYIPHHEPFQYYKTTANPNHLPPSGASKIGQTDQANHQYDLSLFTVALNEGRLPAVSFLKAVGAQDGHAGYSDPIDEQAFVVNTINAISQSQYWKDTAIIIAYDDSDGWYDHAMDVVVNQSDVSDDQLTGPGACGVTAAGGTPGRCGYGPRLPLIVISPYAKHNYVDHRITDQSSILRFIEDNWDLGRIGDGSMDSKAGKLNGFFDFDSQSQNHKLILDPSKGTPLSNVLLDASLAFVERQTIKKLAPRLWSEAFCIFREYAA